MSCVGGGADPGSYQVVTEVQTQVWRLDRGPLASWRRGERMRRHPLQFLCISHAVGRNYLCPKADR